MPATRKTRLTNPLKKLRKTLGDGEKPLDQVEFANRIGMSVATVRGIEGGRRPLSDDCRMQIFLNLSARWDSSSRQWCVLDSDVPYEKKHSSIAETLDPEDHYVDDYYVHRLIERLLVMFKNYPSRRHLRGLLQYLSRHLKETAVGFGIDTNLLKPTEPVWGETRNPKPWGKPLGKEIVFWAVYPDAPDAISPHQDAGGIFDFRSWRSFHADDYPEGRPELQNEMVQKPTADTEAVALQSEVLTAPIPDPKAKRPKNRSKNKVRKGSPIGSQT